MTNKLDLELLNKVSSPASLDEKILQNAKLKIAPKQRPFVKLATSLAAAYCFGLITMVSVNQITPKNYSVDSIAASDINLESLRVETRSGKPDKAKVDLDALDGTQLKIIAKALTANEQWQELEKLTLYIQKRNKTK
jgi:hypothetical protein